MDVRGALRCLMMRVFRMPAALAAIWLTMAFLACGGPASATAGTRAPYRGIDTWYALGPELDETSVLSLARATVDRGLARAGYRLLWLDAGWWSGARSRSGAIEVSARRWPHGIAWLVRRLHGLGMRAGIYTDLGRTGCGNGGSGGHLEQDLAQFAAWRFDALKADFCGASAEHLHPAAEYAALARALRGLRHRFLLAVSDAAMPGRGGAYPAAADSATDAWRWAPDAAASWRTGPDLGGPGSVRPQDMIRNLELDAAHDGARPGHWGDPDYLTPDAGLTPAAARSQIDMWAMLTAPLMLSARVQRLPEPVIQALRDPLLAAIDAAAPARRVAFRGGVETWRKTLPDGRVATVRLNVRGVSEAGLAPYGDELRVTGDASGT